MKFATIIASSVLFASPNLVSGASLRAESLTKSSSGIEEGQLFGDGNDFEHRNLGQLRSAECAPMMEQLSDKLEQFVTDYTTDQAVAYFCNPVEREIVVRKEQEMEKDMETQTDPCKKALERELLKQETLILDSMSSSEACQEEITKEMEALKTVHGRKLAHGRELVVLAVAAVGTGAIVLTAYGMVGYAIGNAIFSDRRLKHNIELIGASEMGIPMYTFQYLPGIDLGDGVGLDAESTFTGVMAQDLLEVAPDAVVMSPDGYYRVDYSKIDVTFHKVN